MLRYALLLAGIVGVHISTSALAADIRTYRFIVDGSLPYSASCGECGPPLIVARADIDGTFTVALDFNANSGTLLALNDSLVNFFNVLTSPSGPVLEPGDDPGSGIIPAYFPSLQPPLEGSLVIEGDTVRLFSDGSRIGPDGAVISGFPSYVISMTTDEATFSMEVPIIDYFITVENAAAVRVVPEAQATGDFNSDGQVDNFDLSIWETAFGTTAANRLGDANSDLDVDGADFLVWQRQLGRMNDNTESMAAVPEPATRVFLALMLAIVSRRTCRNSCVQTKCVIKPSHGLRRETCQVMTVL